MLYICLESLYRKRCEQQMVSNRQGLCLVGVQYAFSGSGGIHILRVATPRPGMEVLSSQKCWSLKPLCLKPISLAPFHFQPKVTFVCERNVCFGFKQVSSLSLSLLPRAQLHLFDTKSEYTASSKEATMNIYEKGKDWSRRYHPQKREIDWFLNWFLTLSFSSWSWSSQ